MTASLCR